MGEDRAVVRERVRRFRKKQGPAKGGVADEASQVMGLPVLMKMYRNLERRVAALEGRGKGEAAVDRVVDRVWRRSCT